MAQISKRERKAATVSHYGADVDLYIDFDGNFSSVALAGSNVDITELVKGIDELEVKCYAALNAQAAEAAKERIYDRLDAAIH